MKYILISFATVGAAFVTLAIIGLLFNFSKEIAAVVMAVASFLYYCAFVWMYSRQEAKR